MRLCALLTVLLSYSTLVCSVLTHDAYQSDWHFTLFGVPQTTFFHRPSASSNATLLYILSERGIFGAVKPKDGTLVWRQALTSPSTRHQSSADGLTAEERVKQSTLEIYNGAQNLLSHPDASFVVTHYGPVVSAWDAASGKLIWQWLAPGEQLVQDAHLVARSRKGATGTDVVVLIGSESGELIKLDGASGFVVWQQQAVGGGSAQLLTSTSDEVFHFVGQSARSASMKTSAYNLETGAEGQSYQMQTDGKPRATTCSGQAFAAWYDEASKSIKVNVLGSKKVHSLTVEKTKDSIDNVDILTCSGPKSPSHFLAVVYTSQETRVEGYHLARDGQIQRAFVHKALEKELAVAVTTVEGKLFFAAASQSTIQLYSSAKGDKETTWQRETSLPSDPSMLQIEVVARGRAKPAIRVAEVSGRGEWTLTQNTDLVWTRHEMLANVVAATWADDTNGGALAHDLNVEGHQNPLRAYIHRVRRHVRDLQGFPAWLTRLPSNIMSGMLSSKNEVEKGLLGKKLLIVATDSGDYFALDPLNGGGILWKAHSGFPATDPYKPSLHLQEGILTAFVPHLGYETLNATDGSVLSLAPLEKKLSQVAIIPGSTSSVAYHILADGAPESVKTEAAKDGTYLVTKSHDLSDVQGWVVGSSQRKTWTFTRGEDHRIRQVTTRPSHDPVSSIGKVLGDRSVLYKYLSSNLLLILSTVSDTLHVDLLDAITGRTLYSAMHTQIDPSSPLPCILSENWFAYSFLSHETSPSSIKTPQLIIAELFESSLPNDRGPVPTSGNISSFTPLSSSATPHVITQAFTLPYPVSHLAVTQTAQGITSRQLLLSIPSLHALASLPLNYLDPRRPLANPTPHQLEEGLAKYFPVLDLNPKLFLSHAREVWGVEGMLAAPTKLESTGVVVAYGLDLFGTRVAPSRGFDSLGRGFNKLSLVGTVLALAAGTWALGPVVRRGLVKRGWGGS